MKTKWFFVLLMVVTVSAKAQFRNIPAVVTDSFKARYANASHVTWKDKLSSFQADFKQGQDDVKANFTSKGEWLKSEKKFSFDKLSQDIKDGFRKSKYADWPVKEVTELEDAKEGKQLRITVKKGDVSKRYLYFSPSGQLLSDSMTL